jgi:hypothetical protein
MLCYWLLYHVFVINWLWTPIVAICRRLYNATFVRGAKYALLTSRRSTIVCGYWFTERYPDPNSIMWPVYVADNNINEQQNFCWLPKVLNDTNRFDVLSKGPLEIRSHSNPNHGPLLKMPNLFVSFWLVVSRTFSACWWNLDLFWGLSCPLW